MRRALVAVLVVMLGCASFKAPPPRLQVAKSSVAPPAKSAELLPPGGDADGDGVLNQQDKCPKEPEDVDGFEDADGCPDPDNDADGILDVADKCPLEPETINGWEDEDGCPDKHFVDIGQPEIVLPAIHFAPGTTKFLDASNQQTVHDLAELLQAHPEFILAELDGFTDDKESPATNVKLSLARAKVVVAALVADGVDAGRLRVMGFGPYCPTDLDQSNAARERNRRVELKILRTVDGVTGLTTGCTEAAKHGLVSPPP